MKILITVATLVGWLISSPAESSRRYQPACLNGKGPAATRIIKQEVSSPWSDLHDGSFVHSYRPFRGRGVPIYLSYDPSSVDNRAIRIHSTESAVHVLVAGKYKPAFFLTDAGHLIGTENSLPAIIISSRQNEGIIVLELVENKLKKATKFGILYEINQKELSSQDLTSRTAASEVAVLLNSCLGSASDE